MSRYATPKDLIPEAHCVLGTMLRPFSLGHRLLLHKIESPFVAQLDEERIRSRLKLEGIDDATEQIGVSWRSLYGEATPYELALAVFVCAARYSETQESMLRGDWESDFSKWLSRLKPHWWQRTRFDHATELARFVEYLRAGYSRPPVWRHDAPGVEITAPDECLLKCRLVGAGFVESEVLEKFLPAAWYDYYTVCELRQAEELTNPAKWRKIFYTARDHAKLHPEEFS